jgi:ubiquinone/menaquinone biosynthesis C-methylase UbiE
MVPFLYYRRSSKAMRRLYDRIYRYYGRVEKFLGPKIDAIVRQKIASLPDAPTSSILEYACGSGLLSLKLARYFKTVTSHDLSTGMLMRARERAEKAGIKTVFFSEGNILNIDEPPKSYDYAIVSFALHLFPPETEKQIIANLSSVAQKAVIIIDHGRKWDLRMAIVEWFEGGYYDKFIKMDFEAIAHELGCRSFREEQIDECTVLSFFVE